MNKFLEILILIGIIILGLIMIGVGVSLYKNITVETPVVNQTVVQPQQNISELLADYEENKVTRSLKAAFDRYTDEDNLTDLCSIWATKESNSNLTEIWKNTWDAECVVQPTPAPKPVPQPTPAPQPTPTPVPPKPTCKTTEIYNATTNECVAKPTPPPAPIPTPTGALKVAVVGDIQDSSAGTSVYNQIKKQNPEMVVVLGDLGYDNDLKWFKSTYGTMGDKVWCMVGNHEADNEDGSAAIERETKEYCGNSYWVKKGATMFMMFNTNDNDFKTLITNTGKVFDNKTLMSGVKTVHVFSHKPCAVPPNQHHGVESEVKLLCDAIKFKTSGLGLKTFYTQAHNHVMSESNDKSYKQVGSGGRSHYTCGTNAQFPFCNNVNYGFLMYTIQPDGTTISQFIDYNGRVIR